MQMLWNLAQMLAKEEFKEEGISSWDEIDKYEREDRVHSMYEKVCKDTNGLRTNNLRLMNGEWQMRDPKTGRFCKATEINNNTTTNTNLNKKENDTMMNRNNAKETRMETLKANGIATENFFDLSMRVPMGAEIKILVNGQEMVVPTTTTICSVPTMNGGILGTYDGRKVEMCGNDLIDSTTGEVIVMGVDKNDPIAQSIINDGYVKNSHLFRRWIFAHTIKMLEYVDRRNSFRKGWEACMKDCYSYGYQFEMMADELHTLAKLQKEDPEYFAERTKFFNGDVAVALLNDYLYRLGKYVRKQLREHPRTYRGQSYVKLARYGNVLVKDLDTKVYAKVNSGIADFMNAHARGDYKGMEKAFKDFMDKYYNKLPYETPKCAVWKDAFKGIGAFESLKNAIRFHNVILEGCDNKYDSEKQLYRLLDGEFKNNTWKFHQLLVDTLNYNKFNLRQSIANGHAAQNTTSDKANAYRK